MLRRVGSGSEAGQSTLEQKCVGNMSGKETDEALQRWYDQLEQKLQDLRISHITALQSRGQIRLMRENDCQLIDRISAALNGVFPVWRNQITMLLANTKKKFSNRNSKK